MEKNKIFIFNIGQDSIVKHLVEKLQKQNYDVVVGPSNDDHNYLMTIPYYKNAYENKIFAFCADVYRCYVLSTDKGLYIDTSVIVGEDFKTFYEEASKYKTWLPRTSDFGINICVAYGDHSTYMKEALEFYIRYDGKKSVRSFPILPSIVTMIGYKKGIVKKGRWDINGNDEVHYGDLLLIRNENTIKKMGGGSWFRGGGKGEFKKKMAERGWVKMEKRFRKKRNEFWYRLFIKHLYKKYMKE